MKRLLLLSICVFFIGTASAQWSNLWLKSSKSKHLLYTNGDMMVGTSNGGNLGMSFVYNSKFSVQVGYSATSKQLNGNGSGLKSASSAIDGKFFTPEKSMENFNVMLGRHFNLNSKETVRLVLQGGPGMSVMMEWLTPEQNNQSGFVKNSLTRSKDLSVMLNSKIEFPVTSLIGISAGPTMIVNQDNSYFAFTLGFMYGIIKN